MRDRDLLNESYYGAYGHNRNRHNTPTGHDDRDWASRAADETRSWFGDREAERRRQMDEYHNQNNSRRDQIRYQNNQGQHNYPQHVNSYSQQSPQNRNQGKQVDYNDYDTNYYSDRSRIGHTDNYHRSYNSHSMYAVPSPDPVTGRRRYYTGHEQQPHENHDRGLGTQFKDEVKSWFGDDEAARRREMDERNSMGAAWHGNDRNRNSDYDHDYDRRRYHDSDRDREWVRNHNINNGWW